MSRARNKPREQIPTARPRYANDPSGFWTANAKANDEAWSNGSVIPRDTIMQIDANERAAILRKAISLLPTRVRWGAIEFDASLDDGQSGAPLDVGGTGATGLVTITFSKSDPAFSANNWPGPNDELEMIVRDNWKMFQIDTISEGFNQLDDAVIAIMKPEDSAQ